MGEARGGTVIAGVVAGSGMASAVSPAIEGWLNLVIGGGVLVLGGGTLLVLGVRSAWESWALDRDCRQSVVDEARRQSGARRGL